MKAGRSFTQPSLSGHWYAGQLAHCTSAELKFVVCLSLSLSLSLSLVFCLSLSSQLKQVPAVFKPSQRKDQSLLNSSQLKRLHNAIEIFVKAGP